MPTLGQQMFLRRPLDKYSQNGFRPPAVLLTAHDTRHGGSVCPWTTSPTIQHVATTQKGR